MMLPKGFLGRLSEAVFIHYLKHHSELLTHTGEGFGMNMEVANDAEKEKLIGMFSEWIVYDFRHPDMENMTGLEWFLRENPLPLSKEKLDEYADLLHFELGLYDVDSVDPGKGVIIMSRKSNKTFFLNDVNSSNTVKKGEVLWGRIAQYHNNYYGIGCVVIPFESSHVKMIQKIMEGKDEDIFTVPGMSMMLFHQDPDDRNTAVKNNLSKKEAKAAMEKALADAEMQTIIPINVFEKWIKNDITYGPNFALQSIIGLIKTEVDENILNNLLQAASTYANTLPKKSIESKIAEEKIQNNDADRYLLETFDLDYFDEGVSNAHEYMQRGVFGKSYKGFEKVVQDLLEHKQLVVDAFRIFANAGIVHTMQEERIYFGRELFDAALRMNPQYAFAQERKDYLEENFGLAAYDISKLDKKILDALDSMLRKNAQRAYSRSVFGKYEKFILKSGISLDMDPKTQVTVYSKGKNGTKKIGRNEPCYCGSGKKYKQCHLGK